MFTKPPAPAQPSSLLAFNAMQRLAAVAHAQIAELEARTTHPLFFLIAFFFSTAATRRLAELRYVAEALDVLAEMLSTGGPKESAPQHAPRQRFRPAARHRARLGHASTGAPASKRSAAACPSSPPPAAPLLLPASSPLRPRARASPAATRRAPTLTDRCKPAGNPRWPNASTPPLYPSRHAGLSR